MPTATGDRKMSSPRKKKKKKQTLASAVFNSIENRSRTHRKEVMTALLQLSPRGVHRKVGGGGGGLDARKGKEED